eukprot:1483664-Alexandrium_andersonii.AAC.1
MGHVEPNREVDPGPRRRRARSPSARGGGDQRRRLYEPEIREVASQGPVTYARKRAHSRIVSLPEQSRG